MLCGFVFCSIATPPIFVPVWCVPSRCVPRGAAAPAPRTTYGIVLTARTHCLVCAYYRCLLPFLRAQRSSPLYVTGGVATSPLYPLPATQLRHNAHHSKPPFVPFLRVAFAAAFFATIRFLRCLYNTPVGLDRHGGRTWVGCALCAGAQR